MPTEHSWTEVRRGLRDLRALLAFRASGLSRRDRGRLKLGGGLVLGLTAAAAVVPAYLREPLDGRRAGDLVAVLPTVYLGFLVLAVLGAVASGGGREIVPRDELAAFPVSTVTEHAGALLLAPLNVAWLIQAWTLLGVTSYVLGPQSLGLSLAPVLLWILAATALGQAAGWVFEGVRRGRHGTAASRTIAGAGLVATAVLVLTGQLVPLLDRSPTVRVYLGAVHGHEQHWTPWLVTVGVLAALALLATLAGLAPARWALHRTLREEVRLESGHVPPRPNPLSDLAAMVRLDRASIWRSVPLRRGLLVLALMPGLVAVAGRLEWNLVTILPGLVASGAALLFGVNTWCLDGRGALWRDSLPVPARVAYYAKVIVLTEVLASAAFLTVLLAALRAGSPTSGELASALAAGLVVCAQVVGVSMRWSVERPFAVELRSARATPAPPVVMAGYSARLAARTTLVGLVFSGTAAVAADWRLPVLVALPMVLLSALRVVRLGRMWEAPDVRARVIATVAS